MARIIKCLSMDESEIQQLEEIAKDTGMTKADVVRELIRKAYIDKYCRQIITKENFTRKAIRKAMGKTSHNVQCENENSDDTHTSSPSESVSMNTRLYDSVNNALYQEGLNILKTKSYHDFPKWGNKYPEVKKKIQLDYVLKNTLK